MCGICGFVFNDRRPIDTDVLSEMTRTILHRGPDAEGYHTGPGVGFGHRRLSIIDVAGGDQPLYNEDASVCVVHNGEIYNYLDLRQDLETHGHEFHTKSDTEVLVHLYEERGVEMLESLSGMFAFALWDARTRSLLLARDRMGKKPLFFAELCSGLVFGSEMKAVLASGLVEREINPDGLSAFLSLNYVLAPQTVVKGIQQVPAGHYLIWQNGEAAVRPYWAVPAPSLPEQPQEGYEQKLHTILGDAVERRLMSEVPLGVLLSGGLDSSAVVALMAQRSKEPIKTFSIGFREKTYDELEYARLVAKKFNTEHHELIVESDLYTILSDLIWILDEPFGDASAIPMYHLARFARSEVTVALNGDGADELFGGYPTLQADQLATSYRKLPAFVRRAVAAMVDRLPVSLNKLSFDFKARQFVAGVEHDMAQWHYWWRLITTEEEKTQLLTPDIQAECTEPSVCERFVETFHAAPMADPQSKHLHVDYKTWLANDILTKADRTTMGHSLEVRSPFLDHRVVAFASDLPYHYKVRRHETKYLLKRTMDEILPRRVIYRKKKGFNSPISIWFRGALRELLCETLHEDRLRDHGIFNAHTVSRLINEHLQGKRDNGLRLWGLLSFQMWFECFMKSTPGSLQRPRVSSVDH